jgi:hypothetical protein
MADLKVDYQALSFTHQTLGGLASQFQNIQTQQSHYDWAMGSGDVAGAMDNFAGNWTYHRNQLISSINDLDSMVAAALEQFPKTDSQLTKSLTKK